MAYPGDPPGPVAKDEPSSAGSRLTTDEFDALASAFRPSWELDDAPFTGPGNLSPDEIQALQVRGGTSADIRAAVQAVTPPTATAVANGGLPPSFAAPVSVPPPAATSIPAAALLAPAPPPVASLAFSVPPVGAPAVPAASVAPPAPTRPVPLPPVAAPQVAQVSSGHSIPYVAPAAALHTAVPFTNGALAPANGVAPAEPMPSVIVESAQAAASVAPAAASFRPPPAASVRPAPIDEARTPLGPPVVVEPPDRMAKTRIVQRPPSVESTASLAIGLTRSKRPLWIGLGVGVVLLAAVGIWAGSSSSSSDDATTAPRATTTAKTSEPWTPAPVSPPPDATTAPVAPTAPVVRSQPELTMRPSTPVAASPPAAVAPVRQPAPAPHPYVPPAAPRPAPRPSKPAAGGGSTIVHDVPF